jgi:sortase (surface protein transpeptidase)
MPARKRAAAAVLIAIGALFVVASAGYLVYALWSVGRASRYEYQVPPKDRASWFLQTTRGEAVVTAMPADSGSPGEVGASQAALVTDRETAFPVDSATTDLAFRVSSLFPAQSINPKHWAAPLWAGSDPFGGPGLPDGFERVVSPGQGLPPGTSGPAIRLKIPAIAVDAEVRDLQSVSRGGTVSFEDVDRFVGHIPDTADPGEIGTGWYFGHLESPGLGQGNVFYRFPELANLIKQDPVDVYLFTDTAVYIYRVVETQVIKAKDLSILYSREARVALVASFPSRVYTHRLAVFAELFARRLLTGP